MGKLEWWGYPTVKNFEDMYNRLDSIPTCDRRRDRQTDGQTSCHGIVRAMHTRRGVKTEDMFNRFDTIHERVIRTRIGRAVYSVAHQISNFLDPRVVKQEAQLSQRDRARFVSMNISLSHSWSFEMTLLSKACVSPY